MREVKTSQIIEVVERLCKEANYELPADIRNSFVEGKENEESELGKFIFDEMIKNCDFAKTEGMPICQDTGMALVMIELGQEVHITGGLLEDAVNEGVRRGYLGGYLRLSVVSDPLRRVNTNDNTPAILYVKLVAGDSVKITVAPKGFGSENMSAVKMFTPSAIKEDIIDFIVNAVDQAGSKPCPPVIVGVGLGGTLDKAAYLAKQGLLRPVGKFSSDELYADMEKIILDKINQLGIGPQGLGGTVTALHVAIEPFATHIAGLPCAVNIGCHITRHSEYTL